MRHKKRLKILWLMFLSIPIPHIWFTIKQAAVIINKSLIGKEKCFHPIAILVFDEKYNLLGTVAVEDILKGIEPNLFKHGIMTEFEGTNFEKAMTTYEATILGGKQKNR